VQQNIMILVRLKQALSLLIWVMLSLLDCMVCRLCKTQCPADPIMWLKYLHCHKEFHCVDGHQEYVNPGTHFATVPLDYNPAKLHAMHSATFRRQFCLMMEQKGTKCYSVRASSKSVQLAMQQINSSCSDFIPVLRLQQCVI